MKKILLTTLTAGALAFSSNAFALAASDNGGNYTSGWTNGANGGSGFGAWSITANQGTGFAGNFIGDPAGVGISGMATNSFGLYANPASSGANVDAGRSFSSALAVGDTFSFQWGLNWDSDDVGGNKGFSLYSGGLGGTELININMANSGTITINSANMFTNYGANAFTLNFTVVNATNLAVYGVGRDGSESYSNTFAISGSVDSFKFYASNMGAGDQRQPYFNNLNVVPEPSTYALLALSAAGLGGYVIRRRRR